MKVLPAASTGYFLKNLTESTALANSLPPTLALTLPEVEFLIHPKVLQKPICILLTGHIPLHESESSGVSK